MPTKEQLRTHTLLDRGMRREQDPATGRFKVVQSDTAKTPLMLYIEGVTGKRIENILLMQMSTRRLAEWIEHQILRSITQATIVNWRQRFKVRRIRRTAG